MTKQEFLDRLRVALSGRVSSSLIMENVHYYEDYINTEIRKGRGEAEVLAMLGDPRLIAKTIIDTNKQENWESDERIRRENGQWGEDKWEDKTDKQIQRISRVPGWVWLIVVLLIVMLLLSVVYSVLTFLLPIVLPIILVVFLVKLFRDWLN